MNRRIFRLLKVLISCLIGISLPITAHAGQKCPIIDRQNIRGQWEAIDANDLRYFYLDLSSPDKGLLAVGFWHDTTMVSVFTLTSHQISRGSVMLLFESMERNSTDKIVISGKGRACDSTGIIEADVQLVINRSILSRNVRLVFRKTAVNRRSTLDHLKTVSSKCMQKIHKATAR